MSLVRTMLFLCLAAILNTATGQQYKLKCPLRLLSSLNNESQVVTQGPLKSQLMALRRSGLAIVQPVNTPCSGLLRPGAFFLRAHTSDAAVFEQVLVNHEFTALDTLFKGIMDSPTTILDLGMNIGLASAYFSNRYPNAQIAAVEPNIHNFRLAVLNTRSHTRVTPIFGGIWSNEANLVISKHQDGNEWGYVVKELGVTVGVADGQHVIPAYTVGGIMQRMGWSSIDYLKVDIECTEYQLFQEATITSLPWIQSVKCLSIEVHNWCGKPVEDINKAFLAAGFKWRGQHGELGMWCNGKLVGVAGS